MAIMEYVQRIPERMIQGTFDWFHGVIPKVGSTLVIIGISYVAIRIIVRIVERLFERVDFDRTIELFIERSIGIILWCMMGIFIMANWGIDVGAFIAGLGIAGFVLGFALKDTLGNLASGIFLLVHAPFKVGDYVEVAGIGGTVKYIGIAACRINTPDNKKITIQNSSIWSSPIINYTGLKTRRLDFVVGISYSDDIDLAIKTIINLIEKDKRFLKDPKPVVAVQALADSSVNIVARPWAKVEDFWPALFDLNKNVKQQFDKVGINIPFPQREITIKQETKKGR